MKKVIVEISGGNAEVTSCPKDVEVEIIDHDNNDAEVEEGWSYRMYNKTLPMPKDKSDFWIKGWENADKHLVNNS